jgi:hypothetical protein
MVRVPSYRVKATGTCEGDTSDEGTEEEGGLDHGSGRVRGECGIVVDERGEAGEHSSHAHLYKSSRFKDCTSVRKPCPRPFDNDLPLLHCDNIYTFLL